MDTLWIQCFSLIGIILLSHSIYGQSDVKVYLEVRKFVEKGSSVALYCRHNLNDTSIVDKVVWLRNPSGKFFQYIKGRNPPYINSTIFGAEIDLRNSNSEKVQLRNLTFDATGLYSCEVSLESPIYTKESEEEVMNVIMHQKDPPKIQLNKHHFNVGDRLVANCTASKAHPAPHITWLINGIKVDKQHIKNIQLPNSGNKHSHRSKAHLQSNLSHGKHDTSGTHGRSGSSSNAAVPSSSSIPSERTKEESTDANGSHLGIEIHQNSGYDNSNTNKHRNNNKRVIVSNGMFMSVDNSNGNMETSDYFDDKRHDTRKHHIHHSHRKYRRYVNDLNSGTNSGRPSSHYLIAASSQLSIKLTDAHALNNSRLEVTCLATIPAAVEAGEQFADYKTHLVKVDLNPAEQTTVSPAISDMAALGNSSCQNLVYSFHNLMFPLCLPIVSVILYQAH